MIGTLEGLGIVPLLTQESCIMSQFSQILLTKHSVQGTLTSLEILLRANGDTNLAMKTSTKTSKNHEI